MATENVADLKRRLAELEGKSSAVKKPRSQAKKPISENTAPTASAGASTKKTADIKWTKAENHHLTSEMLNYIEEHPSMAQAFSFCKGDTGTVNSGGKGIDAHCVTLARHLFLDIPNPSFKEAEISALAASVRNRVNYIKGKQGYPKWRKHMTETGQGLLDEGRVSEIKGDSATATAWALVKAKFPWYEQMNCLMGASPIMSRAGFANSGTAGALVSVSQNYKKRKLDASDDEANASDASVPDMGASPSSPPSIGIGSPKLDVIADEIGLDHDLLVLSEDVKPSISSSSTPPVSKRKKSTLETVQDMAAKDWMARVTNAKIKANRKLAIEKARLEAQSREADKQREHELRMFQLRLQFGNGAAAVGGPMGGDVMFLPAPGAQVFQPWLDPALQP